MRFLLSCCLLALGLAACGPPRSAARGLIIEDPANPERPFFHDAGSLSYGRRTEHVWRLRNTDHEPVTILSTTPACQCTRTKAVRYVPDDGGPVVEGRLDDRDGILTVPAGGLVELVVSINSKSIAPNHDKLAVLRVNSTSRQTPFLTFEIHVKADKPFLVTPGEIQMNEIGRSHGGSASAQIIAGVAGSQALLVDVVECTGDLTAVLDSVVIENEPTWKLTVTVPPDSPYGVLRERVTLSTTDSAGQGKDGRLEVVVWAHVVDDLYMKNSFHFGSIAAGTERRLPVTVRALVPGMRVQVLGAEFEGDAAGSLRV